MEELIEPYVRYLKAERNLSSYTIRNYRGDLCTSAATWKPKRESGPWR